MYLYKLNPDGHFEVGHFDRRKIWVPESNHRTVATAARRVSWLNKVKCKMRQRKNPYTDQNEFLFED